MNKDHNASAQLLFCSLNLLFGDVFVVVFVVVCLIKVPNSELNQTTTATGRSPNKRYNKQNNGWAFCVFWRTWTTAANFSYFVLELIAGVTSLVWGGLTEQFQIIAKFNGKIQILFFPSRRPWRRRRHCLSSLNQCSQISTFSGLFTMYFQ